MDNLLPPGFRFYPTEEELISFYLRNKLDGTADLDRVIPVIDIYSMDPWELPQFSGELCHGDPEQWFFFTPRQAREARGGRPSRTTSSGYWKATGSPGYAYSSANRVIGMKKTMVFYTGRAPTGKKTEWKMNEYRAIVGGEPSSSSSSTNSAPPNPILRHEYSLCRVYVGTGSLRAFDRRPSGVTTTTTTTTSETEMQLQQAAASSSGAGASSSQQHQDSSSSGGDDANPPHQIGENTDWEMTDDDFQSLLDWNNFNGDQQHQP